MGALQMREAAESAHLERATSIRGRRRDQMMALSLAAVGLAFVVACAALEPVGGDTPGGGAPTSPSQPTPDVSTWLTYSNQQFGLSLRYPSDYTVAVLKDQLQPAPIFRAGFQLASLIRPTGMEPPQFAIDVFDNPNQAPLEAWLASSGATAQFRRPAQDTVNVGGVQGIRVVEQTLVAPNTFYYVARGPFIYRFTPLGIYANDMLKTVQFVP